MSAPETEDQRVALAAVAGAHGIKGEVRLKIFAEGLDSLKRHETLFVDGEARKLLSLRDGGKTAVARFEGLADRGLAEKLRGALVEVDRADLPELDEGEYYHADLVGLTCFDKDGETVGSVLSVENFGAGDLLEIEKVDGKKALIPFKDGIADLIEARIVLDPDFLA